jgi:hypothetical protein
MLASDQRLDVLTTYGGRTYSLRERYASDATFRDHPVAQLASHWGVQLGVVTKDRFLVVPQRGNTAVEPYAFSPSVGEGAHRLRDSDASGAPNHTSIARRGLEEELGVGLLDTELRWLSFGCNPVTGQYTLVGRVDSRYSYEELVRRFSVGVSKDKWETRALNAVDFSPQAFVDFASTDERRFSPFALIAFVHCLVDEFGYADTAAAFERARIAVSRELPRNLA